MYVLYLNHHRIPLPAIDPSKTNLWSITNNLENARQQVNWIVVKSCKVVCSKSRVSMSALLSNAE